MNQLPEYAKALLLQGATVTGTFTDAYFYAEEGLQICHADKLFAFCEWIDQHIGGAAPGNIDMLYAAYLNPDNKEMAQAAEELAEEIRSFKAWTL